MPRTRLPRNGPPSAMTSIAFEPTPQADYGTYSSYLGTDSRRFSRTGRPSMYLVFDPDDANNTDQEFQRVILHEFGHALGLIHEHMRPDRPLLSPQPPTDDGPRRLLDSGPLYAGETASRIHDVRPAADLVRDLAGVGAAR